MSYLKICILCLFFGASVWSQEKAIVLNQILFSESEQSWSTRDMNLFEKVMLILNKKNISPWSEGRNEDFLLSRLSHREALLFGVTPEKLKISEADRKKLSEYSTKEVDAELERISYVLMFVDLKENQLKQKDRFVIWMNHLKRKYQAKIKYAEPAA
ncbi:MAG: hypothetical protein H7328_02235 [Bdellovibrio sp.]|nr:hypothetical protein [Bdellovibrio sp.]